MVSIHNGKLMNKKRVTENNLEIRYANTIVTSAYTSIPVSTLETMRVRGGGIEFVKFGKTVVYDLDDVDKYMQERKQSSTSVFKK